MRMDREGRYIQPVMVSKLADMPKGAGNIYGLDKERLRWERG